jgi:hypothetical protein
MRLHYKAQFINAAHGNVGSLLRKLNESHKYILWAKMLEQVVHTVTTERYIPLKRWLKATRALLGERRYSSSALDGGEW